MLTYNYAMYRIAKRWGVYAWIAALAVLFNALAPVVSHVMSRADMHGAQADICTAMGAAMAPMPGKSDPDKLVKNMTHCGYCATHAASFAMPSAAGLMLALPGTHDTHPSLFFQSPYPLPVWTSAQSRAPPAFA